MGDDIMGVILYLGFIYIEAVFGTTNANQVKGQFNVLTIKLTIDTVRNRVV